MTATVEANSGRSAATRIEELGRIILAYSEVTEKLQESHERLERTVHALRNELSEKNKLLERKNRLAALGEMAAGLAHEIRNPLGGIKLYASMLAKDVADRPESAKVVKKVAAGVNHLEALVSQVLQFTRDLNVNVSRMDLAEIVRQVMELSEPQRQKANVICHVEGPASLEVTADSLLLSQAILNLVLNAAEAMAGGGELRIGYGPPPDGSESRQFCLVVQDSGPGIAPEVMERIFNPFFTTKETGTGLGLAIVHRIIEAHDGTIRVSNGREGGARFEVRI